MKNLHTAPSRFKFELFLSLLTLVLIAALCVAFQHHMVEKLTRSTAQAHPVHHIIVQGKPVTDREKLAFEREPQPTGPEELNHKVKVQGD